MLETLETLATIQLIIKDGHEQIDDYTIHQHWKAEPDNPQGNDEYYEQDKRLSSAVVEAIFDEYIDDLDVDAITLTKKQFGEMSVE